MAKPLDRSAWRCCVLTFFAALAVSASDVCGAQAHDPSDAVGVFAAELRSHAPTTSQDWAVYNGRRLNEARQFCAATLLELLAVRLGELAGHSITRVPTPSLTAAGRDTLERSAQRYGTTWGVLNAKVIGDSLVVQIVTAIDYRTQPRRWSSRIADYYLVPSDTSKWRMAAIRESVISDGGCRPGSPDPACRP